MSSSKNVEELPPIQLVENRGWKTVETLERKVVLPLDWEFIPLGKIVGISAGQSPAGNLVNPGFPSNECLDFHQGNADFSKKITNKSGKVIHKDSAPRVCTKGSLLLSVRAPVGALNFAGNDLCYGRGLCAIVPTEIATIEYIYWQLKNHKDQLQSKAQGSTFEAVKMSDVRDLEIPSPKVPEQTLIAQVLTNQESQVHDLRKLAALERQRLSWLSDELLSGRLRVEEDPTAESVVVSRNEKGEPVEVLPGVRLVENRGWKEVELNGTKELIPEDWSIKNVGESIDFKLGNTPPKTGENYKGSTPWVTISNISGRTTTTSTAKINYKKARVLPRGSLIGSFKMTVGKFSILGMDAATNEAIVGVDPDGAPGLSLDYLRLALVRPFIEGASTNGQGVQLLNTKTIKSLCFVAPKLPEQTLIAQVLTAQETQASELERLADLEQKRLEWLSDELLSGRIRVRAVDAEDEQENTP